MIADIEAAVCDDRIGPGFFHLSAGMRRLVRRGKAAFGAIAFGGGFDQCDVAIFPVQVETAFGVTHGGGPERAIFPEDFSGRKFKALHGTAGGPVKVVADFDDGVIRETEDVLAEPFPDIAEDERHGRQSLSPEDVEFERKRSSVGAD